MVQAEDARMRGACDTPLLFSRIANNDSHSIRVIQGLLTPVLVKSIKTPSHGALTFPPFRYSHMLSVVEQKGKAPRCAQSVRLTSQPPVLHFRVVKHYTDAESMPQTRTVRFHVLVPGGHEGEARLLLERFQMEVITVRKQEEEQQRQAEERHLHPPEPH